VKVTPPARPRKWIRLELRLRDDADSAVLAKLRALRPALSTTFLASVSRPITEGCPVRFGLKCSMQWADLQPTVDPLRRFCGQCGQDVLYVDSIDAARFAANRGQCIAVDLAVDRHEGDLREPEMLGLPVMPD
jgi:hypothetical protein